MDMAEPFFNLLPRPAPMTLAGRRALVLGLGDTGLSAARWLARSGASIRVADTRGAPPRAGALADAAPGAELKLGAFTSALLDGADLLCLSPGLALDVPVVREAVGRGIPVLGDIELFAWHVRAGATSRVVAITGTNGKTTVTALTGHLLRAAGVDCEVAGNIGPAVLDALMRRADAGALPAVWVLELSSYQLETTWSLAPDAAAMLNLSEDHLDRYASLAEYAAAKARVFMGEGVQILNRDDPHSMALVQSNRARRTFGIGAPTGPDDFGVIEFGGSRWLAQGREPLVRVDELALHGWHNVANALAGAALCRAVGAPQDALVQGLRSFRGLPHRLERVSERSGVTWYDDSKGTNVGATIAALEGLAQRAVLILGGEGKGQDFVPLAGPVARFARHVLLIGRDAPLIERALTDSGVPLERCATLEAAVARAAAVAQFGDAVLLSPACASFDMFRDYKHRGDVFAASVRALGA
jgi:UDP-N-acetylmuramoylalanine--D-glutamate ligase